MIDAIPTSEIIITAERAPEEASETAASTTVIGRETIIRLGEPLIPALLRLTPSVAVATSGTAGSLAEVRIRGAENNHTLLFIDGIRVNDPATGNQPRYELLNADIASRIEVVRGPQSALWGSEAIGGVISINGLDASADDVSAAAEAGSFGFRRGSASASFVSGHAKVTVAGGWQKATGIDAFDGTGDLDGYRNLSGRARATWQASPALQLGVAGVAMSGHNDYDGNNLDFPYQHMDTLDSSRNRLLAGRGWAAFNLGEGWSGHFGASVLGSRNVNLLAGEEINRTSGKRTALDAQVQRILKTGGLSHRFILALDGESESFRARDTIYFGGTNQVQERKHQAITAEWRMDAGPVATDLAVRRDLFNRFEDVTTLRASMLADLGQGLSLTAAYGEGIAQPTFFDLFGFFPGSFVGNSMVKPESSRGFEASLRYRRNTWTASLTGYRQRLRDEIVGTFDQQTSLSSTVNGAGISRRGGIEAEVGLALKGLALSANYAFLNATEPAATGIELRETRRPKHSGSISADGELGRLTYGASIAYTGDRFDTNFDQYPAQRVRLGAYWLAGARMAYRVATGIELFARASNAFDERYRDAVGYRTEGRSVHAGIRLARR